ncbi:unnamed protein product [Boreogadus saida]
MYHDTRGKLFLQRLLPVLAISADTSAQSLSDTSLQAFAFMTRELGRLMSSLTLARRQFRESCLAQQPNRPWIVASRLTRHGSSLLAFGELHPYRDGSLHKVMAPIVLCRQCVLVVIPGPHQLLSDPIKHIGLPQGLHPRHREVGVPGPQEGAGTDGSGPGVGCFAQQHLICWGSCTTDPWVVATLSQGYNLQFRRRPPVFRGIRLTTVSGDRPSARRYPPSWLKKAIEIVDPQDQQGRIRVSSQYLLALQPWRRRAYLAKGVTLGLIPSRREVVVTDPSLSGWGAEWQHRAVTPEPSGGTPRGLSRLPHGTYLWYLEPSASPRLRGH